MLPIEGFDPLLGILLLWLFPARLKSFHSFSSSVNTCCMHTSKTNRLLRAQRARYHPMARKNAGQPFAHASGTPRLLADSGPNAVNLYDIDASFSPSGRPFSVKPLFPAMNFIHQLVDKQSDSRSACRPSSPFVSHYEDLQASQTPSESHSNVD